MNSDRPAVIDPQDAGYVLPAPPRTRGEVVVVPEPDRTSSLLHRAAAAQAIGERFHLQAECLQQCLREVRDRLAKLDVAVAEDSRAQLKGAVRELDGVVDWCEAIQDHLVVESRLAAEGAEPLDLVDMCRSVARRHDVPDSPVTVVAERPATWWGAAGPFANVIDLALALVAERTNGRGPRVVRVAGGHAGATVEVSGRGEPADIDDPVAIDRFRAATAALGATVVPDALGPGSAGLVIRLPEPRG